MRGFRRQFGVVARSRGFRLLWFAALGSTLGTMLATVALVVDVHDRTHSGRWVSVLFIVQFLPPVVVGLFFGPLLDRLSRRATMITADLVRAAVFAAMTFAHDAQTVIALAAVSGLATGFFRPAAYAGLPNLVEKEDLSAANAVLQTGENASWAVGPVLGGVLVAATNPHVAYWVNAVSFVFSAALLAGIPARMLQVATSSRGHLRDLRDGMTFVLQTSPLRAVLIAWTIANLPLAAINMSEVFLAKDSFNAGDIGYGILFGASGVGLAIGSLFGARWIEQRAIAVVYGGGIALFAIGAGAAAISPNVWVAAGCVVVSAVGNGAAVLCNTLLVQRGAPDEIRGRAFTVIMSVTYAAFGAGLVVGGFLRDSYGARWVWGIGAVVLAVSSVCAFALTRGEPSAAAEPEPAV